MSIAILHYCKITFKNSNLYIMTFAFISSTIMSNLFHNSVRSSSIEQLKKVKPEECDITPLALLNIMLKSIKICISIPEIRCWM
jgi:hypothetical protein